MISFRRLFSVSCTAHNYKKQGIKLCKMINPTSKKQWFPVSSVGADTLPSVKSLSKVKHEPGKRGMRRVAMLNKIFMKQITDLMSTGSVSMDIVGRGIEISKVKVTPDFQTVNVFWVCKGNSTDEQTEAVLSRTAGALRHELSKLRVMGEVPYIVFVKDRQEALLVDIDRRLSIADYGEDFTPTEIGHILKTEFTLSTKLSPEMKAKIKQVEEEEPIIEDPIPEMTHTVYGLDHEKIINRLLGARKKTRDAWSSYNEDPSIISYRVSEKTSDKDVGDQKKELADFLLKRQILQNKLRKQLRDSREEWQLELRKNDSETTVPYYYDDVDIEADDYYYEELENNKDTKNFT